MTDERRYGAQETRDIFELATRGGDSANAAMPSSNTDGLTLAELQEIGVEVGIDRAQVARAAIALDARLSEPAQTKMMGMPIGVASTLELPRALTDLEWDRLVAELRSTFGVRGRVIVQGGLREWVNGNLHACVEPTERGYQLRLGTIKGNASALNAMGGVAIGFGALSAVALMIAGKPMVSEIFPVLLGLSGTSALIANYVRLPRWANQRERQMQHVAERIPHILRDPATDSTT